MSVRAMEETLGVKVPEDLRAFFGEEVPTFGGEAAEPLSTEEILAVDLPPLPIDFLPIAGNGAGDFLCARLGPHGDVLEMVAWKHDDWSDALPFGRTLAEALLLSLCSAGDDAPDAAALAWALAHAPAALADAIAHGPSLRDVLLDRGVGVESLGEPDADVHGSRTEIHSPLFQKYYGVADELAAKTCWYDLSELPAKVRAALDADYDGVATPAWDVMERASSRVLGARDDVGWAHVLRADLAGRRGDEAEARRAIAAAATCLERTFHLHGQDILRGVRALADDREPVVAAFLANDAAAMSAHWEREAARAPDAAAEWSACYRRVHHMRQASLHDDALLDAYARAADRGGFACFAKLTARRARA